MAGDKVILAGDYDEEFGEKDPETGEYRSLYDMAIDWPVVKAELPEDRPSLDYYDYLYFYSKERKEYLNLGSYFKNEKRRREALGNNDWLENPVSIMLATEEGGGGDFHCGRRGWRQVGRFCGTHVGIIFGNPPKGFKDITDGFIICEGEDESTDGDTIRKAGEQPPEEGEKYYTFTVKLSATGTSPEEAWEQVKAEVESDIEILPSYVPEHTVE